MIIMACVIAFGTYLTGLFAYASGDFDAVYPVWPWAMHKNFAGTTMAFAALICFIHPSWAGLSRVWTQRALWFLLGAILLTQSRQAWIGLIVAIIVAAARGRGRSRWLLVLVIPAIWLIVVMVIDQVNSQNEHNSVFQRFSWFREVYVYWKEAPWFGHGLRFWYVDPALPYQPPQAELEVIASAGVVGLLAFGVMWLGILVVLWRIDPQYGTLALVAVLSRIVQGQFDLFWISVGVSVPFVIAGICLGALARSQSPTDGVTSVGSDDVPTKAVAMRPGS